MDYEYAIALTGGIATGKSTVGSLLRLYGMIIIDADEIAHKILDSSLGEIKALFGERFIVDEKVDRVALGAIVFSNKEKRETLQNILHPKIKAEIFKQSRKYEGFKFPYLIDIPLFFETKNYKIEDSLVIYTNKNTQIKRFMQRNKLTKEEALERINTQMDIEEKKIKALWVIDNNGNLKHLQKECQKFVDDIKEKFDYKNRIKNATT